MKYLPPAFFHHPAFGHRRAYGGWAALLFCAWPALLLAAAPPAFTSSFAPAATLPSSAHQITYAPHLLFPGGGLPVQTNGQAEVTNATQIFAIFVGDSLGHTNMADATAATGFQLAGGSWSTMPGIVAPPPKLNTNNNYFAAAGIVKDNHAWLLINLTPGTNTFTVTNHLQVIGLDGNNNQSTNWVLTNLYLRVQPPAPQAPHLEVRFYNSSTNPPGEVYILPTCKGLAGSGFWWSHAGVTNNWTNWMTTTTNMTVSLADIGVSGTNTAGQPYYAIYTTNFPNAAWFVSYRGGHLKAPTNASGQWDGTTSGAGPNRAQPTSASTMGLWFGSEWNAFELTLDGNAADVGDTTYINQFSIPMAMRVFTNNYEDAMAGVFRTRDSSPYYKIGGWTNFNRGQFSNLVAQMRTIFAMGVITNAAGVPVMIAGPSSAGSGTLAPPWNPPAFTNDSQNVWPRFTAYFEAVKSAQPARHARIKDFIGLSGGAGNPTYNFYYDFALTVTPSNALRLEGSMVVTNAPGSSGTYYTNATGLLLEIAADAGPHDNWASWSIYTAPTPANLITIHNWYDLNNGQFTGYFTNLASYSAAANNQQGGTLVTLTGSNLLGAVQVAFCGAGNSLIPTLYFTVQSDTNLIAYVPYGALTGPIVVTTTNGSGVSTTPFTVAGTPAQTGPSLPPGANIPAITTFQPASGIPAAPICGVSGNWMDLAVHSQTGPAHTNASLGELYSSSFGSAVMGRIVGDLAAGFAFGFINSDVLNLAYQVNGTNQAYGDSPSGAWWGGNEFSAANTNRLAYHQVNTHYSEWGNALFTATAVTYGHPIYDRMKVYDGTYTREVIAPPVALNGNPNIWMAELEFFDGMASVYAGGSSGPYTLLYQPRAGGAISGAATQTVNAGQNGTPVEAVRADTSVVFRAWSDGRTDNPRTDSNVVANLTVQPLFYSRGGADLAWYAGHGFTPGPSQEWSELDQQAVPAKGSTLLAEYTANTNPNDTNSFFHVMQLHAGIPLAVLFTPAASGRVYTVQRAATGLHDPAWENATGALVIADGVGTYSFTETNAAPVLFYRTDVALP